MAHPNKYIPEGLEVTHPRKVGMIIKALIISPASVATISHRLQYEFKYKHYPDPRAISNYLSKYKSVFEVAEKTRNYTIWKIRDDVDVMDRKVQAKESE
tara:strand:- start:4999 stop:5295 length:297 start_codon:yes stop_codon:yes gene_type:complete